MDFGSGLGANRSDTEWYREDEQRRPESKGIGFMCMDIGRTTLDAIDRSRLRFCGIAVKCQQVLA